MQRSNPSKEAVTRQKLSNSPSTPIEVGSEAERVANYIKSLKGFEKHSPGGNYGHVGATLANAILQKKCQL